RGWQPVKRGDDVASAGEDPGEAPPTSFARAAREWVVLLVAAFGVALLLRTFLLQPFGIPSASMVPTLQVGDKVLVNKISYDLHDVNRGDVIVFKAPPGMERAGVNDLIKRVIGLPGETVEGREGHIYVNDRLLAEPYLPGNVQSKVFGPEKIPPGRYWMLGDNRQNSQDSTYFGTVDGATIVGRAFVRWWPLGRLGLL
ncbi:MAG: signal peptidase I, partial [Acidimicrobiia bacterium]